MKSDEPLFRDLVQKNKKSDGPLFILVVKKKAMNFTSFSSQFYGFSFELRWW
jgi:hypothetical protein